MNELSPPPARLMRAAASVARGLARLLLVFGVLLALDWAVLQLWIVPRIADFRPRLEALASQAIGQPVRIGDIVGHAGALVPSFDLLDVDVLDAQGHSALRLPRLTVAVSLQSVLRLNVDQIGIERPSLQFARRFPARRSITAHIGRPGIQFGARNRVPRPAFPDTEIHFGQARIDQRLGMQRLGQCAATRQRATPHRQVRGQFGTQARGQGCCIFRFEIESTVTDACRDQRPRVTDQVEDHFAMLTSKPR